MSTSGKVTGSHLIARALQMEGVKNVFTLAGDHVLPALDVLADQGFRFVDTRHEQAATHMADAWGRITGQPGVVMYTTPGFSNGIPGLANAVHSEAPIISISGSAEFSELGRGAMQEIDQIGMAKPVTKGAWMVTDPRRIPDMIANAVRVAYGGRRGPVHLTIPVDIQQQYVSEDEVTFYEPSQYRSQGGAMASPEQITRAVELMRTAERPLIIAGSPAAYSNSGDSLQRLIETTRFPLMTEGDARGLVSDEHPYCFGFFDAGLNWAARLLREADLVLVLGRKQDLIMGYAKPPTVSMSARMIQVDPSAAEIGRNRGVDVGIVGDVTAVVDQLSAEAARHPWSDLPWLQTLAEQKAEQAKSLEEVSMATSPMHAIYVHKAVSQNLSADDFLVFDGGDFCHWGRSFHMARRPKSWWYLPPSGMLGSSLPTALAAKLAYPDRRVVMFTGDGGFGFNGMEFDTAVRHNLAVVAIMGNDSAWSIDRHIQVGVFGKPVATDLLPSRYDQMVRGLGAHGEHIENPEELPSALERALKLERPALLNVQIAGNISPRAAAAVNRWKSHLPEPI